MRVGFSGNVGSWREESSNIFTVNSYDNHDIMTFLRTR